MKLPEHQGVLHRSMQRMRCSCQTTRVSNTSSAEDAVQLPDHQGVRHGFMQRMRCSCQTTRVSNTR